MSVRIALIAVIACLLISLQSNAQEGQSAREYIQLPSMAALNLPFSDAVLVGDTLYLSGNGGLAPETMTVPEDPKEEARLMMENIAAVLAEAGMTMDNLVTVTVYCTDLSLYSDFNEVYSSFFGDSFPARAFIGSGPLLFGMRFEMQAIAVK